MTFKTFVSEFLALLEHQESRLLSWGFYGGSFDAGQVDEWLAQASDDLRLGWADHEATGESVDSLLELLREERQLFELPDRPGNFRTRFAEGVRLLASLRQLFPGRSWTVAPRLISDVRMHLSPRLYPRRDVSVDECWSDLENLVAPGRSALLKQCLFAFAGYPEPTIAFAGFQRRAFHHIFSSYGSDRNGGSVVSAGTGSGKTKAFYVPAFLRIIDEIAQNRPAFTKVIAIYPRTVLLADQLREALSEAAKVAPILEKAGLRQITFGALLGDTPNRTDFDRVMGNTSKLFAEVRHWRRVGNGFVVPFLKAPSDSRRDLIWRDEDRAANRSCLYSNAEPGKPEVPNGVVRLTRESLQEQPPDILFLSAEMLNRELGNSDWSPTFGIGKGGLSPRLLLLDEVHTYQGIPGAQTSWLLRRWRYWARIRNIQVVGLSATLADAPSHLARVGGVPTSAVTEFRPKSSEMVAEGIEYNLAVKGNPAGTSLLATSIQTAMLINRLLAPSHVQDAGQDDIHGNAFFGRKVFGFTDNLDTLNRWLADMKDAEQKHLPRLRQAPANASNLETARLRADGQLWELCTSIGHKLSTSLRISGCSSQRPGINSSSDLVIATSSLEVGFDDPEVGAVVHHKRPSSMASFVQRKGRSGRRRGMRPWTVVVLSDYGADRFAFHNSEQLFSPEIGSLFLPVRNPYVLRQQAVYFLLEWLGLQLRSGGPFSYFRPGRLSEPTRRLALRLLNELLEQGPKWQRFRQELERFFASGGLLDASASSMTVDSVLWNDPRPLLLEVIPSLLRKVEANWAQSDPDKTGASEDRSFNRPLPAYIPGATFGELDLSEVTIRFTGTQKEEEQMGLAQALYEFCPGRVSKRYSTGDKESGYWLETSAQLLTDNLELPVNRAFPDSLLLDSVNCEQTQIIVYQPISIDLAAQAQQVTERSNAFWQWQSLLKAIGEGTRLPLRRSGIWNTAVKSAQGYLHREQSSIEILRFAQEWDFDLQMSRPKGQTKSGTGRLCVKDEDGAVAEAIGFRVKPDGLRWEIDATFLSGLPSPPNEALSGLRTHYYLDQLRSSPELKGIVDRFSAEWVHRTSLAMLSATALKSRCTLEQSQIALRGIRQKALRRVLDQIIPVATDEDHSPEAPAKLRDKLVSLWSDPIVLAQIEILEGVLWKPLDDDFLLWCKRRCLSAISQAFMAAALTRNDGVSEDDLTLDLFWDEHGDASIYLSENGSGGLGHIEGVVYAMRESPGDFPEGVRHALNFCPRDQLATSMYAFLRALMEEPPDGVLRAAVAEVRGAKDFKALESASEQFRTALSESSIESTRSFVVAAVARFIRPGSTADTDRIAYLVNALWRRKSRQLGVDIDPTVWAYVCANYEPANRRFSRVLTALSGGTVPSPGQVYRLVQQLLIEGCGHSCPECLADVNHFNFSGLASRRLALEWFGMRPPEVTLDSASDWRVRLREMLKESALVELIFPTASTTEAMEELQILLAEELEVGSVLVPAMISAMRRRGRKWVVQLQLRGLVA
jgi:hypothetical protein